MLWFSSSIVIAASVAAGPVAGQATGARQTSAAAAPRWDPPRTTDGQPDMQGYWSQRSDITTYSIQAGLADREEHEVSGQAPQKGKPVIDPPDGKIPHCPGRRRRPRSITPEHTRPSKVEYWTLFRDASRRAFPGSTTRGTCGYFSFRSTS